MREDGYAAVTSRRVGERAGLKSQLVHYHFGTMDELFQAAFRRSDRRFFAEALKTVSSKNPLQQIWKNSRFVEGGGVVAEYVAAANHRKVLQDELVQSWSRFRALFNTVVSKQFEETGIPVCDLTPRIMNFLISSIGKAIIEETSLGYTEDHDEVIAFMDKLIEKISDKPSVPRHKRVKENSAYASVPPRSGKPSTARSRSARNGPRPSTDLKSPEAAASKGNGL